MKKIIAGVVIGCVILLLYAYQYVHTYDIPNEREAIESEVEARLGMDIELRDLKTVHDKLVFTFTTGSTLGSGELVKGRNNKYRYLYAGYGTNGVRERVIETNNGQFLMLTGRNSMSIQKISASIDEDLYDVEIPEGEYYLTLTPVKETGREFTSGMVLYDRDKNEIIEIK